MNIKESHEIWICACCIGEAFLRECIEVNGSSNACHYCEETCACFTLETISNLTEQAIGEHFVRTSDEPSTMEYAMIKHCGQDWYRDGEEIGQVIEDLLQTSPEVAHDVQQLLEERHSDFDSDAMGLETEFACESHYVERQKVSTGRLNSIWERFVTTLKTESRYINPSVRETLDSLFSGVEAMRSGRNGTVIIEAGPDTDVPFLFRARWCRGHDELESILITPDRELGPPPYRLSGANRMSARGISVFYGASSAETAISEIRPPVGCNVVCAKFILIRPLRLLNLLALENVWESGSMLDPDFIRKREQAAFLRTLTSRIVDPVLPGEEDFSYIPTQVIAEYLAESPTMALDGILYPSVQLSGLKSDESYNVVLFHKASCVRYQTLPAQEGCRISYGHQYDEDDWETDICVTEITELVDANSQQEKEEMPPHLKDNREPAIEIDLLSVSVHGIRAARFEYSTDTVRRDKHVYKPEVARPSVSEVPPWNLDSNQDDIPY